MTIQINTDNRVSGDTRFTDPLKNLLTNELSRFKTQITRLEVHLSDEDGNKNRGKDKRCLLEARLENMNPIAVTDMADTHEQAVKKAIDKLIKTLENKQSKLMNY